MADHLTIEVTGFEFISWIDRAAAQLERPGDLMNLIGATLESNIANRFNTKTDPSGAPWAPLARSTLARKNGTGSLLEFSGYGKKIQYNAGDDFVEVGSDERYMGYHETGTKRMPRRAFLTADWLSGTLGQQDEADVLADIQTFLDGLGLS